MQHLKITIYAVNAVLKALQGSRFTYVNVCVCVNVCVLVAVVAFI